MCYFATHVRGKLQGRRDNECTAPIKQPNKAFIS